MRAPVLQGESLTDRLEALGSWLPAWRALWDAQPFREHEPPWVHAYPELARALAAMDEDAIEDFEADPTADLDLPEPWPTLARASRALVEVGAHPAGEPLRVRHPLARRIKGRKWSQVAAFLATTEPWLAPGQGTLVEWCSGRGHLGRTLARRLHRPARLLEVQADLCAPLAGMEEADGVAHVCVDVLDDAALAAVPQGASLLALHACGRLTDRLIEVALARGATAVAAAPCCPHRLFGAERHGVLSQVARSHGLDLPEPVLRLAVLDEVVARPKRRWLRRREHLARVAVDLLAREATGRDEHFGFRTVPRVLFEAPLADVVQAVHREFALPLPPTWDVEALERRAAAQVARIRAYGLVRLLFRRPIELWLVLDRAQALIEAGWDVRVGTFVDREATPRNLLVLASAPAGCRQVLPN